MKYGWGIYIYINVSLTLNANFDKLSEPIIMLKKIQQNIYFTQVLCPGLRKMCLYRYSLACENKKINNEREQYINRFSLVQNKDVTFKAPFVVFLLLIKNTK